MNMQKTKTVKVDLDFELSEVLELMRQNTAPYDRQKFLEAALENLEDGDIDQTIELGFGSKEFFSTMSKQCFHFAHKYEEARRKMCREEEKK